MSYAKDRRVRLEQFVAAKSPPCWNHKVGVRPFIFSAPAIVPSQSLDSHESAGFERFWSKIDRRSSNALNRRTKKRSRLNQPNGSASTHGGVPASYFCSKAIFS